MNEAIKAFFDERKAAWLKKNTSPAMETAEIQAKEQECEEIFALSNWLPNAAKRAGQINMSTHPCTFSHPSARKNKNGYASSIIAESKHNNDGFLRSGNVSVESDALGNAAALDVYKFLNLVMEDKQSLIKHIQQETRQARELLTNSTEESDYETLKSGFLSMMDSGSEVITSSKIKQVFFPATDSNHDYHQLSILSPSGIVFDLRKRLDTMRFGEDIKAAREAKKNQQEHTSFREIYDLTTIAYGGTKPQNISVLNNQNGGKAHLFISLPPPLKKRETHFPKTDFFSQNIKYHHCTQQFRQLHTLYSHDDNNMNIRAQRDKHYQDIIDYMIEKIWEVRSVAKEQYQAHISQLSAAQTTLLCELEESQKAKRANDDWLDEIFLSMTAFIFHGYEKILGRKSYKLGHAENMHIQAVVEKNKELLR